MEWATSQIVLGRKARFRFLGGTFETSECSQYAFRRICRTTLEHVRCETNFLGDDNLNFNGIRTDVKADPGSKGQEG
jgi:hypothetical protein